MRPEGEPVSIPDFPPGTQWINAPTVQVATLLGQHALLVWFWDYTSLNSLRALPYLQEWHQRYAQSGLKLIGVHSPQFDFGEQLDQVRDAVARLEIEFPVASDSDFETWKLYGNEVWPALYLWDRKGVLRWYHFAEGEYQATEEAIQELLVEIDNGLRPPDPMEPLRPTDRPDAKVIAPTPHSYLNENRFPKAVEAGDELSVTYSGASAGAVLDGRGRVDLVVDGEAVRTVDLEGPRLYELVDSGVHEQHQLKLRFRNEALAYAFSFGPGPA